MKRIIAIFVFVLLAAFAAQAQATLQTTLEAKEKKAWDEFGKGDGKWFDKFLTADAMLISDWGMNNKAETIKNINTKPCEIKSFKFNNFKAVSLNATTAIVTYEAEQDATCGGQPSPKKVYCSSVYVKVGKEWKGALHQESTAMEILQMQNSETVPMESYYYYTCNTHGKLGHYPATADGLRQCVAASNKHATDFRDSPSGCVLNQ